MKFSIKKKGTEVYQYIYIYVLSPLYSLRVQELVVFRLPVLSFMLRYTAR